MAQRDVSLSCFGPLGHTFKDLLYSSFDVLDSGALQEACSCRAVAGGGGPCFSHRASSRAGYGMALLRRHVGYVTCFSALLRNQEVS